MAGMENVSGELITVVGLLMATIITSTTALLIAQARTHKQAKQANQSVNDNQPGQLTLYRMVASLYARHEKTEEMLAELVTWRANNDYDMQTINKRLKALSEVKENE